jgi:adenylate cyclase
LGEPEVAIGNSEKALRLSPRDPGLWAEYAQLGQSYLLLHQEDRSIEFFIKARAANPRIWYIHYFLAAALGLKGEIEQAQTALAESLRRKPEINSIAQYYAVKPWYISPRERELEERTLNEGLRRIRFPEE